MKFNKKQKFSRLSQKSAVSAKKFSLFCFLIPFITMFSAYSIANSVESIEEIRHAAKKFLEEKQTSADNTSTEVIIGQIDPRIQLTKCDEDMEVFLPQTAKYTGKTTVGIRCHGPVAWKIYVSAEVVNYQYGWVVNRNILPGEILTTDDFSQQQVVIGNNRMIPVSDIKQLLNTSPKRRMRAGSTIYHGSVCLVCRGDKVNISADNQFLSINVEGVALSNAVLGEVIQVQNTKSKKVFDALVTGKNQLQVNITGLN